MKSGSSVRKKLKNVIVAGLFQKIMAKALEASEKEPPEELTPEDLDRLRKKLEKSKQQLRKNTRKRSAKFEKDEHGIPYLPKQKKKKRNSPKEGRQPSPPREPEDGPLIRYEYEPVDVPHMTLAQISYGYELSKAPVSQQYDHYLLVPF